MLLISECISVESLQKNKIIYGVGNEIRIIKESEETTLPWKLHRKVHGIRTDESSILCFGERHFMLISLLNDSYSLMCTGEISDWISGATFCGDNTFCLVTSHSVVLKLKSCSENQVAKVLQTSSCEDKSTLYCSFLMGSMWDDLIIFGGNAFGELIIWQPKVTLPHLRSPVLLRILAHQGALFSINVNQKFNMMTTTSDDRSVKFWKFDLFNENNKINWEKSNLVPYKSSYGHTARVFQAKIIEENSQPFIISCGEDSCICLWNSKGDLLHKVKRQFGLIFDFSYDSANKTIFASTSSGNIIKYGINDHFNPSSIQEVELPNESEYLAKVKFLGRSNIIGITSKNNLIVKKVIGEWEYLRKSAYKCIVFEVFDYMIATGGYKTVSLYNFNKDLRELEIIFESDIMNNIIRSLFIFSKYEFLICDDSGMCIFTSDIFNTLMKFEIPQSKERWVTSALKIDAYLVLSNRQGNIFLFSLENGLIELKSTIKYIHGHLGVTSMLLEKRLGENYVFKTCGHDGTVKTVRLDKSLNNIEVVHTENVPIHWIEKLEKAEKGDNLVIGFNDNHFVIWKKQFDFLLQLPCGGGHRFWDFQIDEENNKINVIYIKNKSLFEFHGPIRNVSESRVEINNHFWHAKTCNILKIIQADSSNLLLISGGEDNLLKFSRYNFINSNFEVVNEMFLHISSIKAIEIVKVSENVCLVFSAGGRAQICISQFNMNDFSIEEKCNFMLKFSDFDRKFVRDTRNIDFDPETRIMSLIIIPCNNGQDCFEVFAGCSDGYIRKFLYKNNEITFCAQVFYNKCILHLRLIKLLEKNILISCSTDGIICFWEIEHFTDSLIPIFKHKHHDSGINSIDIKFDNDFTYIITGGDDQSIVMSKVLYSKNLFHIENSTSRSFHSAQVNGIKISNCNKFVYSVGVDQQICKFNLSDFTLSKNLFTCIGDSKGLELWTHSNNRDICIAYGSGVQILEL